jgi:MFS family permease
MTVSLVQVAVSLPLFLFTLPSGALADVIDSRRLLIVVELAILAVSAVFAGLVSLDLATPALLLATTFLLGVGGALTSPAWGRRRRSSSPKRIWTARSPRTASASMSGAPLGRRSAGW